MHESQIFAVYFPVGHTHGPWDRRFRFLMLRLREENIVCQEDLERAILSSALGRDDPPPVIVRVTNTAFPTTAAGSSTTTTEGVQVMDEVLDLKTYLTPFIERVKDISVPHLFFFSGNAQGETVMQCKPWATSQGPYYPAEGHVLLKPGVNVDEMPLQHPFSSSSSCNSPSDLLEQVRTRACVLSLMKPTLVIHLPTCLHMFPCGPVMHWWVCLAVGLLPLAKGCACEAPWSR